MRRALSKAIWGLWCNNDDPVDAEIQRIINKMNRAGFRTYASCSGFKHHIEGSNHKDLVGTPYVAFRADYERVRTLKEWLDPAWEVIYLGEDDWGIYLSNIKPECLTQNIIEYKWVQLVMALQFVQWTIL